MKKASVEQEHVKGKTNVEFSREQFNVKVELP